MPVPAGISLPMMMFSLSPNSRSDLPSMAASVSTLVVSWNDAADSHESVASDALVMPISSGRPSAGRLPSWTSSRFDSAQHLAHDQLDVLVVDRHTLIPVHRLDLVHQVQLGLPDALDLQQLLRILGTVDQGVSSLNLYTVSYPVSQ